MIKNFHMNTFLMLWPLLLNTCSYSGQQPDSFPFEYREIHLPETARGDDEQFYLNSVDRDWGIWGHNLSAVLPENPSPSVYARVGNGVNRDQFCFSSDALYDYICNYIRDNYGKERTSRFAILPNDNAIVCLCRRCREYGNKEGDASGAVYHMLGQLTERFPKHIFFTSSYRTTNSLPSGPLPDNAGVLISAIDFPLSPDHCAGEDEFVALVKRWTAVTKRIYVWDYVNNFDDYFTPLPIFEVFQHRLRLYARLGVNGIFMNGSGTDYSTFYRLKRYVLAALLADPDAEWRPLLHDFCRERYPVAGEAICDFILKQEDMVRSGGKSLPLYEGVSKAVETYLPADEFIRFYDKLSALLPKTEGKERERIGKMCRAMTFTRLELKRLAADTTDCSRMLDALEDFVHQGYRSYSESGAGLDKYVSDYRYILQHARSIGNRNQLKGVRLEPLTALDEDYNDIGVLTDGLLGLPSCYHCGLMLSSADPALRIAIPAMKGLKRLRVCMARNSIYHIALPQSVSLCIGGRELGRVVPKPLPDDLQRAVAEFDIPSGSQGSMVLTIVRNKEERTMALDEIEGF
ncbi:MAG: DUF4838 domain-containing protein [Bacteroidaceae bacterium]|nr:DUF4838 domain-containing protein [Bacteroidaceae bacterium]